MKKEISKLIVELRKKTGFSQSVFAGYYNIPVRTLQAWEAGRREPPVYVYEMMQRIYEHEFELKG